VAGPTGIEPATPGLKVRCSSLTELRTHLSNAADSKTVKGFFSVSVGFGEIEKGWAGYWMLRKFAANVFMSFLAFSKVSIVWLPFWVSWYIITLYEVFKQKRDSLFKIHKQNIARSTQYMELQTRNS
jgi:hypothetical protein